VSPGDCCFFRTGSPLRFQWNWFLISDVMITVLDFIPRYANSIKNFQILQDFFKTPQKHFKVFIYYLYYINNELLL
jgi:hypothetical protein